MKQYDFLFNCRCGVICYYLPDCSYDDFAKEAKESGFKLVHKRGEHEQWEDMSLTIIIIRVK